MKKILALLLSMAVCLSFSACGGGNDTSAEKAIIGAWNMEGEYDVFVFSNDGKVTRGDEVYDWWYDKDAERYCLSWEGLTYTFVIEQDENGRFFSVEGVRLYYVKDYDPEAMKAEYIKGQIARITEGKTELTVGNAYTTESGIEFTLERVEITNEESCCFNLYLTSDEKLEFEDEQYASFSGNSYFGIGWQPEGSEGNYNRYAGSCFKKISSLEADKGTYGFLSFTIEGVAYYIPISTFFG